MVDADLNCGFCDKVYIRRGALQKNIKAKHQDQRQPDQQDQGHLFPNIDIPEDVEHFPGGGDDTLIEAVEDYERQEAARDIEGQLNQICDSCTNSKNKEMRLGLKIKALENTNRCLIKQIKDQTNELTESRRLLAISA